MLVADLIVALVIAAAVAWGLFRGLHSMLAPAGFAVGAVLGTRVPLILGGNLHSTFSLVAALPAALVLGATMAALVERRIRRPRGRGPASAAGGAVLAGAVGVVLVWTLGTVAAQIASLRDPIGRSTILARLNSALEPVGPKPNRNAPPSRDSFPRFAGPPPDVAPADPRAETDPDVRGAERSVVKIGVLSCGHGGQGSGWVVADRIVVTNAHVVASADAVTLRSRGTGPARPGSVIWFDPVNDLALVRVPKLRGVPALAMVRRPRTGASGAALGFPLGLRAIRRARLGPTTSKRRGLMEERPGPGFRRELFGRLVTTFRANVQPGSSGGPVVDRRGRVLTTVFGGTFSLASGLGVPNRFVSRAVRQAGPTVSTGRCLDDSDRARRR